MSRIHSEMLKNAISMLFWLYILKILGITNTLAYSAAVETA